MLTLPEFFPTESYHTLEVTHLEGAGLSQFNIISDVSLILNM